MPTVRLGFVVSPDGEAEEAVMPSSLYRLARDEGARDSYLLTVLSHAV